MRKQASLLSKWPYWRIFLWVILFTTSFLYAEKSARLLVHIGREAPFSPEEFAKASSALLVQIDPRNPFKALHPLFVETDFVVLSDPVEMEMLERLAKRYGYRFVSFSEDSLQAALDQTTTLLRENPKYSSEIPRISKEEAQALYDLLEKTDQCLVKNHITYWATGGTLLGALRFKGLIPWDDDIDLCIFESDEEKLAELGTEFAQYSLELYRCKQAGFYKVFDPQGTPIECPEDPGTFHPYRYPFIDIFVVTLAPYKEFQDLYIYKWRSLCWHYPCDCFFYSELENIHRVSFGPLTIPIPANAENWAQKCYGIDGDPSFWKKYAQEPDYCHRLEKYSLSSGAAFVELDDFTPIPLD